jgi:hypothetical protein
MARKIGSRAAAAALALALGAALPGAAGAAERGGAVFAERADAGSRSFALCGTGLLRWRLLKAYAAALYLEDCAAAADPLADVPKRLEIEYFWSISAERFGKAAEDILARQHPPAELAPLRERLDRMARAYRDVERGDRYALSYAPGAGTTLAWNGEPLVTIPGADFARAYFGIWLGEASADDGLRAQLLGG